MSAADERNPEMGAQGNKKSTALRLVYFQNQVNLVSKVCPYALVLVCISGLYKHPSMIQTVV